MIPWAKRRPNKPKIVIGDNLTSHLSIEVGDLCEQHNIRMSFMPPNSILLHQPLDVFGPLQSAGKQFITAWKMENGKHMTTMQEWSFSKLLLALDASAGHGRKVAENRTFRLAGRLSFVFAKGKYYWPK